jgi:hypothetical protein
MTLAMSTLSSAHIDKPPRWDTIVYICEFVLMSSATKTSTHGSDKANRTAGALKRAVKGAG